MSKTTAIRIVYFLAFCCNGAWVPKLYDFCVSRGLTEAQSALILSIPPIMMFAVQPLYGYLADKLGHKKTLLLSALIASLSFLGFFFEDGYYTLIAVTLIMSIFYNTVQPVLDTMTLLAVKENPKVSYGSFRFYGAVGYGFAAVVSGQVIDVTGISVIFIVSGVSMFLAFCFSFFLANEPHEKNTVNAYANVWSVIKNPALLFLLFCVFLVSLGSTTIWNFYSTYLKEKGATDSLVGYSLLFQGLWELPLFYFSSRIIFRFGLKTTLFITVLAMAARMVLYYSVKSPITALPIELLHGISWSLFWVTCVEYVNKLVDKHWLATAQSLLYATYYGIGAIAGNYWTTTLKSNGMPIAQIFLINGCMVAVVAAAIIFFNKKQPVTAVGVA